MNWQRLPGNMLPAARLFRQRAERGWQVFVRTPPAVPFWQPYSSTHALAICSRKFTSRRNDGPTIGDMAIVAGSLARKAAGAVGEALLNAAKSLLGRDKSAPPKPEWSSVQGMGLLGRLVGPMIQAALSSAASELAAAGKSTATARSQAEQILTCSPELAAALGGGPVQVVGVLSQGSVTQSVNGALSRRVVMQLVVRSSASGQRAQTSVECDVGAGGEVLAGGMTIWAVLESGRRIQVPVHDAGVGGKPIDVHWKRVD